MGIASTKVIGRVAKQRAFDTPSRSRVARTLDSETFGRAPLYPAFRPQPEMELINAIADALSSFNSNQHPFWSLRLRRGAPTSYRASRRPGMRLTTPTSNWSSGTWILVTSSICRLLIRRSHPLKSSGRTSPPSRRFQRSFSALARRPT